jgi:hypothetical protein
MLTLICVAACASGRTVLFGWFLRFEALCGTRCKSHGILAYGHVFAHFLANYCVPDLKVVIHVSSPVWCTILQKSICCEEECGVTQVL